MTDNEIIKALECCSNADCVNCPNWSEEWYSGMCSDFLPMVLDLINRQRAEIERLEVELKAMRGAANSYKAEVERLTAMVEAAEEHFAPLPFKNAFDEHIDKCKTSAIKEFAESVKMEFYYEFDEIIPSIMADKIDNLVKEMTEEEKK